MEQSRRDKTLSLEIFRRLEKRSKNRCSLSNLTHHLRLRSMLSKGSSTVKRILIDKNGVKLCLRNASSFKDIKANKDKEKLSYLLDATMREGHHDMTTFGLGFLRSVSSVSHQAHTFASLKAPYSVLEHALDNLDENSRASIFWKKFSKDVRKTELLTVDLQSLGGNDIPTPAAARYVASIQRASEEMYLDDVSSKGDLLLGHAYVRYLADLFGGSMLGNPTKLALNLKEQPTFYVFPPAIAVDRMAYIESFYQALNDSGLQMDDTRKKQILQEAINAFGHNSEIYKERPYLIPGAIRGGANILTGYIKERIIKQTMG